MEGPDKGWSWVVAAACFFASLVLAGIFRTSGVLFVAFIHSFEVTREEASWPMVLCISVLNLTGIGWGFMNTLMPGVLNAYFLNLRATANGIANSGSCFGSLILPIVFEYFIEVYGLAGCFLLTGGIVLHIAILGALMRPPPWLKSVTDNDKSKIEITLIEKSKLNGQKDETVSSDSSKTGKYLAERESLLPVTESNDVEDITHRTRAHAGSDITTKLSASSENPTEICSMKQISDIEKKKYNTERVEKYETLVRDSAALEASADRATTNKTQSLWDIVQQFVTVLICPMFYVTAITSVSFYFLYHMYVVIIVDFALDRGVPPQNAKDLLFAFSIADLFGRLCFGWITDRKFISRSKFVMMCMILIGIVFFLFPFSKDYWTLIASSCGYGLLLGCTMVIFPILLVDFLGIKLHSVSYGCMCFMNGFASFGRPFLIGYFRDHVGSYSKMFYVLGGISTAASLLWLLESLFAKKEKIGTSV